jgi:protein-S-isoprenylcysteine O-methyltransferase Ste14
MQLLPVAARWSGFFEKYVLSLMFLHIALGKVGPVRGIAERVQAGYVPPTPAHLSADLLSVLTLLFGLFFGLSLLFNRPALQHPQRWREILVPLFATFMLYAFTGLSPYVPESMTKSLLPLEWQHAAVLAAIQISLVGYVIALWSVLYLGRSLALVVSVRPLQRGGPYRFVRHPMYLGYLVLVLGIAIASSSPFAVVLYVTYVTTTVYRARLEEETLLAFSGDYRHYAARTGFLFPGLGRIPDSSGA